MKKGKRGIPSRKRRRSPADVAHPSRISQGSWLPPLRGSRARVVVREVGKKEAEEGGWRRRRGPRPWGRHQTRALSRASIGAPPRRCGQDGARVKAPAAAAAPCYPSPASSELWRRRTASTSNSTASRLRPPRRARTRRQAASARRAELDSCRPLGDPRRLCLICVVRCSIRASIGSPAAQGRGHRCREPSAPRLTGQGRGWAKRREPSPAPLPPWAPPRSAHGAPPPPPLLTFAAPRAGRKLGEGRSGW
jgi:hypothetical protein